MGMAERATMPSGCNHCSLLAFATEDELIVSQILLDLRYVMDMLANIPEPKWGRKRKRSCLSAAAQAQSSPAPSLKRINVDRKSQVKVVQKESTAAAAAATETASPDTPLAFPPCESDEKPKAQRNSKNSSEKPFKKKQKKELIAMIEELTQSRDFLRKEIQNVSKVYNKLLAQNSKLKSVRQKVLNSCPVKEEAVSVKERIVGVNLGAELITLHHRTGVGVAPHLQPLVSDQTAENIKPLSGPIAAAQLGSSNGLEAAGPKKNMIPDLNISADLLEAAQPLDLDDRVARSAEARRKRKEMMKSKACVSGDDDVVYGEASQPLDLNGDPADSRARSAEARRRRKGILNVKAMKAAASAKN